MMPLNVGLKPNQKRQEKCRIRLKFCGTEVGFMQTSPIV